MFYKKTFKCPLKMFKIIRKRLTCGGKLLKILLPEYRTSFWTKVNFVVGKCKLYLYRVFKLWISELEENRFLFLATSKVMKVYIVIEVLIFAVT